MVYCTQCGEKLDDLALFCSQCGKKLENSNLDSQSSVSNISNEEIMDTEEIVEIIYVQGREEGKIAGSRKTFFFTTKKLIVAKGGVYTVGLDGIGMGAGGLIGHKVGGKIEKSHVEKTRTRDQQLDISEIVNSDPENYTIPYSEIENIEIFKKLWVPRIKIVTYEKTIEFEFAERKGDKYKKQAKSLISVLGDKVTLK